MKKISIALGLICALISIHSATARHHEYQTIQIEVHPFGGPKFMTLVENYSEILGIMNHKIIKIEVTGKNGYGTPLAGYIKHEPGFVPTELDDVDYADFEIDCMWGNFFQRAKETIHLIKLQNKKIFSFEVTGVNGYGKPCAAKLGYF